MKKNIQKLAIFTVLAGLTLVVSGCLKNDQINTNQQTNQNINQNQNPNVLLISDEIDTSGWKVCNSKKFSVRFKYPNSWGNCIDNGNSLNIETNYQSYKVYLVLEIRQRELNQDIQTQKKNSINWRYQKIKNGEIFGIPCGGAFECDGVIFNNEFYELGWLIESNQSRPIDWDGLWIPDHNISRDDIWNILSTIEKIN